MTNNSDFVAIDVTQLADVTGGNAVTDWLHRNVVQPVKETVQKGAEWVQRNLPKLPLPLPGPLTPPNPFKH
jgi:hypothetical protein